MYAFLKDIFSVSRLNVSLIYISYMLGVPFFPATIFAHINGARSKDAFLANHYSFLTIGFWKSLSVTLSIFLMLSILYYCLLAFFLQNPTYYKDYLDFLHNHYNDFSKFIMSKYLYLPVLVWYEIRLFKGFRYFLNGQCIAKTNAWIP
ncbi:MAG: hypothetical protein K0R02_718 [Rickettsiaceae bacterium]|jgi:uncharacterized membrane protein|nr:hypothetical protein [Rickettsiaceae bacterium]